jgi:hypothetical protein
MSAAMEPASRTARAGGCLLAATVMTGAVAGLVYRQPTIGLLAGLGIGLILTALVWLLDRRR